MHLQKLNCVIAFISDWSSIGTRPAFRLSHHQQSNSCRASAMDAPRSVPPPRLWIQHLVLMKWLGIWSSSLQTLCPHILFRVLRCCDGSWHHCCGCLFDLVRCISGSLSLLTKRKFCRVLSRTSSVSAFYFPFGKELEVHFSVCYLLLSGFSPNYLFLWMMLCC